MLLILFNRGSSGPPAIIIPGPYYVDAAQPFVPGVSDSSAFVAGQETFQTYSPGAGAGEACPS